VTSAFPFRSALHTAHAVVVMRRAGMVVLGRPDDGLRSLVEVRRWGPAAGAVRVAARRDGAAVALIDERGPLTYTDLDRRSNALARGWTSRGLGADSVVAVLCRDHRGLVEAMLAAAKLGARLLLLNTGFGRAQLADVVVREGVGALVHDAEFADLVAGVPARVPRYVAWGAEDPGGLECLIVAGDGAPLRPPRRPGGLVLLTSGTTGTPRGALRELRSPFAAADFLDRIPLRQGEVVYIGSPVFHATGLATLLIAFGLGGTVVLRRRFDATAAVRAAADHRCTAVVLVPTMLARVLDLGPDVLRGLDRLRIVLVAGSALPPEVGNRARRAFGEVLYNLYGSTEVSVATVATPLDWRTAPGTVGRPPYGTVVRLFDERDRPVTEPGRPGRIFVGNGLQFGGYTGGGGRPTLRGLMASGDIGHLDRHRLLFVDGRDDDMIVSGGENVFPGEIEGLLAGHERVADAAVVGVPDREFGQRLRAYVVSAAPVTAEELREYVRANLARYKVPREVVFCDALPRNATGKLLRDALGGHPDRS
jgi:fatty-acyl-CoA synthase